MRFKVTFGKGKEAVVRRIPAPTKADAERWAVLSYAQDSSLPSEWVIEEEPQEAPRPAAPAETPEEGKPKKKSVREKRPKFRKEHNPDRGAERQATGDKPATNQRLTGDRKEKT